MKASERPYAAARLIRHMLQSAYSALKSLMYKLDCQTLAMNKGLKNESVSLKLVS